MVYLISSFLLALHFKNKWDTTKGKNVIVSDELKNRMIKPWSPEIGTWKENTSRKHAYKIKPNSSMLIHK
jgi:hypothetical protein